MAGELRRTPQEIAARFWSYVDRRGPNECWPYTGARDKDGYGVFTPAKKSVRAHRYAFELKNGPAPPGVKVRHSCDNPPCCNDAHLLPGTTAQNNADMKERGRSAVGDRNGSRLHPERLRRGEAHPIAKLNADAVRGIRAALASREPQRSIASRYGVSQRVVSLINRGRLWRSVA